MDLLISKEDYIRYRINKGELKKDKKLDRFISWGTSAGRNMFSITKIDERIRVAAKFMLDKELLIVCTELDEKYCKKFGELTGAKVISNYTSSVLSNTGNKDFFEPDLLFVTNVDENWNAIKEAGLNRMPVIGYCNTNSDVNGLDLIVPINITNRLALGVSLWLILNEMRKLKKEEPVPLEEFIGAEK